MTEKSGTSRLDLSGLQIFQMSGVSRTTLEGSFSEPELAKRLSKEWVPYFECDHCGRVDYCKYTVKSTYRTNRHLDIKCGVAVAAITNLVKHGHKPLQLMSREKQQKFLDGAFHLFEFIYHAELQIGNLLDPDYLKGWDSYAPSAFGQLAGLRTYLDAFANCFSEFDEFKVRRSILFVEGWSEEAFISRLKQSGLAAITSLNVKVYQGSGNKTSNRIQMLLEDHKNKGYVSYIQGDADGGKKRDAFRGLIAAGLIEERHSFAFEYDFESSIPDRLLWNAISRVGEFGLPDLEAFKRGVAGTGPVLARIKAAYSVDLSVHKIPIATMTAEILNETYWWGDEEFLKTELGAFLVFIREAH